MKRKIIKIYKIKLFQDRSPCSAKVPSSTMKKKMERRSLFLIFFFISQWRSHLYDAFKQFKTHYIVAILIYLTLCLFCIIYCSTHIFRKCNKNKYLFTYKTINYFITNDTQISALQLSCQFHQSAKSDMMSDISLNQFCLLLLTAFYVL